MRTMADKTHPIKKILVANRGEIAVRVFRTCRDLGIRTAAVFSDADRASMHVRMADEAYRIGPAPSTDSYLNIDAVLDAARSCDADAIHPGYGFLSENAVFAERCQEEGIRFIGPPAGAIRSMGDKSEARKMMIAAGVPTVPGATTTIRSEQEAKSVADDIGYPILIKAAAGGGGKGMRVVSEGDRLGSALAAAGREASSAFGDDRLYIEKYLRDPRHVEIQILADAHGNVIHLFERECTIQRRHQKVVEESPSTFLDERLRSAMGAEAVKAARACGYEGAGTVEFLMDSDRNFYFMEMNTRLQVEHPITEAVTGVDLVAEQIRIAEGLPMHISQESLELKGHAIECRVYAENAAADFLPDPGKLIRHSPPAGPRVRVDSGVDEGMEIPVYYDPMVSKVVAWGKDRDEAIRTMERALDEYRIAGVETTIPFCRFVLRHPAFRSGTYTTHFVDEYFDAGSLDRPTEEETVANVVAAVLSEQPVSNPEASGNGGGLNERSIWWSRRGKNRPKR
jgi:propionyl-CoA carboxylase alpha chain